jgi:sugar phosphate isomerase/epimerase
MTIGKTPLHLTYSMVVHPGERWSDVRTALDRHVVAVRARVAPRRRFGIGLWLGGRSAIELDEPRARAELRDWLAEHDVYVFTMNGAPYGRFQGVPGHRPDWLDEERLRHTDRLARLLAALLPAEVDGSINTIGGALRARVRSRVDDAAIAERLLRQVALLVALEEKTERRVALALEPEPGCRLETVGETVEFFDRHLYSVAAVARLAALTRRTLMDAGTSLRRHLGVCLDACHVAVEFEDPATALRAFTYAGIPVVKLQLGAALRVRAPGDRHARELLRGLVDDTTRQQVIAHAPGQLRRYADLPSALSASPADADEWRIDAHVPIVLDPAGPVGTTHREVATLVGALGPFSPVRHVEVETTRWSGVPGAPRARDTVDVVARDLEWATASVGDVAEAG